MRRGGEGRGGRLAAGVSDTRVTQLFQPMCYNKATELPAYKCTAGGAAGGSPPGIAQQHVGTPSPSL